MAETIETTKEAVKQSRGLRKVRQGSVTSDKQDKTVVVTVTTLKQHPRYGKFVRRSKKYVAHDEKNECRQGDQVEIIETRPLSKTKRWRVRTIVERAV